MPSLKHAIRLKSATAIAGVIVFTVAIVLPGGPAAAEAPLDLGVAGSFGVLAGTGVTNTGPSVIDGDLGTCPTPAVTGFPPGAVIGGAIHANDALACSAKSDLVLAYNDAASRAPVVSFAGPTDLGGSTLAAGVYMSPTSLSITSALSLDAQGDPDAVFIFQAGSTVVTASNSSVVLLNGAQACNVYWQVGSSATLGTGTNFVGTIIALTSITANTNATVAGRLLARNGATTLDSNVITVPVCAPVAPTTTTAVVTTGVTTGVTTTTTTTGVPLLTPTTVVSASTPPGLTSVTTAYGLTTHNTGRLPDTGASLRRLALLGLAVLSLGYATRLAMQRQLALSPAREGFSGRGSSAPPSGRQVDRTSLPTARGTRSSPPKRPTPPRQ